MKKLILILSLSLLAGLNLAAQTIEVDEPAICYQCHSDFETKTQKAHVHAAFESGICSDCHNPHATKHASLLNDKVGDLCLECHDSFDKELVHSPVKSGQCLSCHDPHASDNPSLMNKKKSDLCQSCHSEVSNWLSRAFVHQPVAEQKCDACHDPHQSSFDQLLGSSVTDLCLSCHKPDQKLSAAHKGNDLTKSNCVTCHDPHSSSIKGLIMANQHKPFASGNCTACHEGTKQNVSFAVKDEPKALCLKCHRSVAKNDGMKFKHVQNDEKSCLNCHNPHASSGDMLLASRGEPVCLNCHFNNDTEKPKEYFMTHVGTDCAVCHSPHGSNDEYYMKMPDLELCNSCHTEAHSGSHPVGEEVIAARTNKPVTCLSCHKMHGSDFDKYLPLDPKMDLCIQCHDR